MYEIFEKILESQGLRPVDVANGTGIRKSSFTEWKNGKSKPNTEKMIKIANFLGVSVEYLVTGQDVEGKEYYLNSETKEIAQTIFENKDLRLLFDSAKNASSEDLQAVYTMLKALKSKEGGNIE